MRLSVLEEYNKTAEEPLKNARNAAAGLFVTLIRRNCKTASGCVYYNVGYIEGKEFQNHSEMLDFLRENKFNVSTYEKIFSGR